jgi:MtN3 and saliva related transmembrane protein
MESFVGYFAAFCTTAAFFPQALKVFKTRQTRDISLWMFLLMTAGLTAWLIYGFYISSLPIILANLITLIFAVYILIMKLKLESKPTL